MHGVPRAALLGQSRISRLPRSQEPVSFALDEPPSLSIPFKKAVAWWNLARDIDNHRLAFPPLHQLVLANMSIQELFRKFDARVLDELNMGFQPAIERHRDSPWPRKNFRILNRHLVANGVRTDGREALHKVERSAVKIPGPVEPVFAVEARHIHDQRIALPVADRMTHVCVVWRPLDFIQMDRASRIRKRECGLNFVRALDDLKWIRHVHGPWNARQITLQLRIAVDPVC